LLLAAAIARSQISATLAAQNSPFSGPCPATMKFAGTITGPPNQPVTYVFNRTIKGIVVTSRPNTAAFDGSGHLSVTDSFPVDPSQAGAGADELEVLNAGVKAAAPFTVGCTNSNAMPVPRARVFIFEGSASYKYWSAVDLSKCGTNPNPPAWLSTFKSTLKEAFRVEKAYYQVKDRYDANPSTIGFNPEWVSGSCIHWVFTVGHYSDQTRTANVFFVTGRHILGGPMYCTTSESRLGGGGTPSGEAGVSTSGGPITSPDACAALPWLSTQPLRIPH
jgi:hypothetical protein